jgi:hypothetical protein
MKKITILLLTVAVSFNLLKAQLATFTFNDAPYISAASSHANLSVGNIQLSAGTINTNVSTGVCFTDEPYIEASGVWTETTELTAKHFFVDITTQSGYQFSITQIAFESYATGTRPSVTSILLYNVSIYRANVDSASIQYFTKSVSGYNKLTQITLKIANYYSVSKFC